MFLIQNLECVQVEIKPFEKRTFLNKFLLKDKFIKDMFLIYNVRPERAYLSPFNDVSISASDIRNNFYTFFLNLFDKNGDIFLKDLELTNIFNVLGTSWNPYISINRYIDFEKSYISDKSTFEEAAATMLLYFSYITKKIEPFNDEINGSVTITIKPTQLIEDINLSNYLETTLSGKKIKRIVTNPNSGFVYGYLDLVCKDGKKIQNIPTDFLMTDDPKNIWFDNLDIDFRKSFFRRRVSADYLNAEKPIQLTFIY